jgi:S1-C subfamily serine protease
MVYHRVFFLVMVVLTAALTSLGVTVSLWQWGVLAPVALERGQIEQRTTTGDASFETIPNVVAEAIPAVVSIVIVADVPIIERYYEEWLSPFGRWFGNFSVPRERQVGTREQEVGGGTGFFVSADGYVVTNRHVVESDEARYEIVTESGARLPATVVARDPQLDIAILKVAVASDRPVAHLQFADDTTLRLGETVIAIGNALAEFPNSVSVGVVSGLARNITAYDGRFMPSELEGLIQTDAAVNRGNSGGPLLNLRGEVVGVNVAMAGNSENIGFALPASVVANVVESVAVHGEILRPFLGVRHVPLTESMVRERNLPASDGVLISGGGEAGLVAVAPGSPAEQAGLREGDVILSINGQAVGRVRSLALVLRDYQVGDTVSLTVWRDGVTFTVDVTLAQAPSTVE